MLLRCIMRSAAEQYIFEPRDTNLVCKFYKEEMKDATRFYKHCKYVYTYIFIYTYTFIYINILNTFLIK